MHHGRKRVVAGLTSAIAIIGISTLPAAPSNADPDIDDVKARVDRLYHQAEQASERYNDAKIKYDDLKADLTALKADQAKQQKKVDSMTSAVNESIAAQYEGRSASATSELVLSESPDEFLSQLTTLSAYNDVQATAMDNYTRENKVLEIRSEATQDRVEELAETKDELADSKEEADNKLAEAKKLLDNLEAKERERLEQQSSRSDSTRLPTNVPVSGRAAAAVNYAKAQLGDAYVYGAAGPNAFDCSGLTMMAWAQAGVGLPHSSSAQMGSGSRVSSNALKPGDLVFYYSPVSHVGIYIGNGQIVHAANPGTGVVVAGVFSMPFSGAVRPG